MYYGNIMLCRIKNMILSANTLKSIISMIYYETCKDIWISDEREEVKISVKTQM